MFAQPWHLADKKKLNWIAQIQVEMACWNIHNCYLFIYQGEGQQHYTFHAKFDAQVFRLLLQEVHAFEQDYVNPRVRPQRKMKNPELADLLLNTVTACNL
jgi:hypothetical protein